MGEERRVDPLSDRDILIEVRSDMKHVREQLETFRQSDNKQWDKIDEHGKELEGQKHDIGVLTWAFRVLAAGILGGLLKLFFFTKN